MGASLIGIFSGWSSPPDEMTTLANATDSIGDVDGDGLADGPLVFTWSSGSANLRSTIVDATEAVLSETDLDPAPFESPTIDIQVTGDGSGFIGSVGPDMFTVAPPDEAPTLRFMVTATGTVPSSAEEQRFIQPRLRLVGSGGENMGILPIAITVPATP